jgi:hypothetical protein
MRRSPRSSRPGHCDRDHGPWPRKSERNVIRAKDIRGSVPVPPVEFGASPLSVHRISRPNFQLHTVARDVASPVTRSCAGRPCHWRRLGISPLAGGILFLQVNRPPFWLVPGIWPLPRVNSLSAHTWILILHIVSLASICWRSVTSGTIEFREERPSLFLRLGRSSNEPELLSDLLVDKNNTRSSGTLYPFGSVC